MSWEFFPTKNYCMSITWSMSAMYITISIIMMSPRYKQGEFFQNDYVYTLTQTQFYYVLTQQ